MYVPTWRIEDIASRDETAAICAVYLRGDYLEATDSYRFARVPVERDAADVDGPIPLLAFELARMRPDSTLAALADTISIEGIADLPRPKFEKEPPTYDEIAAKVLDGDRPHRAAFNGELVVGLARAIGSNNGGFTFELPDDPFKAVRVSSEYGGEAILMPMRNAELAAEREAAGRTPA